MGRLRDRVREAEERLAGLTRALQSAYDEELSEALAAHDDAARGLNRALALQQAARLLAKPDLAARFDEVVSLLREAEAEARSRVEQLRAVEQELGEWLATPPARALLTSPAAPSPVEAASVPAASRRTTPPHAAPVAPAVAETRVPPPAPVEVVPLEVVASEPPDEEVDLEEDEPSPAAIVVPPPPPPPAPVVADVPPASSPDHEEAELLSFATGKTGPQRVERVSAELPTRGPPPPPAMHEQTPPPGPAGTPLGRMKPTLVPASQAKAPVPHIASSVGSAPPPARTRPPTAPPTTPPGHTPAQVLADLKAKLVALESRYDEVARMLPRLGPEEVRFVLQEQVALVRLVEQRFVAAGGDGATLTAKALGRLSAFASQSQTAGLIGLDRANAADWTRLATEAKAARQRLVAARRPPTA